MRDVVCEYSKNRKFKIGERYPAKTSRDNGLVHVGIPSRYQPDIYEWHVCDYFSKVADLIVFPDQFDGEVLHVFKIIQE